MRDILTAMYAALVAAVLFQVSVLDRAHSHNDYLRPRPLQDALANGFSSVEVDVFLVDGRLLVAHDRKDLKPEKSMESMYLKPLADRIKANGGTVYPKVRKPLWVLVDIKADGVASYEAFKREVAKYPALRKPEVVRFVISGDRPIDAIVRDKGKYAGLDGRWEDLDKGFDKHLMPWVSESWTSHFDWLGATPLPSNVHTKLRGMVDRIHGEGRRLRFWGAPDTEIMWDVHWTNGVDWLNTDDLPALRNWMLARR